MNIQPAISFESVLMFLGGIQGLFFALLFLVMQRKNKKANRYLAILVAALGLIMLHEFLVDTGYIKFVKPLAGISFPLELVFSPALYLYVRTLTQPDFRPGFFLKSSPLLLFFLSVIILLPFYKLAFEEKYQFIQNAYTLPEIGDSWTISLVVAMSFSSMLFIVSLVLSFRLLYLHKKRISTYFSYREKITLAWLSNFLIINVIFLILVAVYTSVIQSPEQTTKVMDWIGIVTIASIFYIGIMGLLQPNVYGKYPSEKGDGLSEKAHNETETDNSEDSKKYKKSALNPELAERILSRLEKIMEIDKPHLQNNLTLPVLAKQVSTTPNYLSQVINEHLNMNFFDYINSHRIDMAKQLLENPTAQTPTVLDVAMACAFNSKSAFYSAFRKSTGLTPVQYKQNLL